MATREEIEDLIEENIKTNNQKLIDSAALREVLHELNENTLNPETDNVSDIEITVDSGPGTTTKTISDAINDNKDDIDLNEIRIGYTKHLTRRYEYFRTGNSYDVDVPGINFSQGIDLISSQVVNSGQINQRLEQKFRLNRNAGRTDILPIFILDATNVHENSYNGAFGDPSIDYSYDLVADVLTVRFHIPDAGNGTYRATIGFWFRALDNWDEPPFS